MRSGYFSVCSDSDHSIQDHQSDGGGSDSGSDIEVVREAPIAAKRLRAVHCNLNSFKTHGIDIEATFQLLDHTPDIVLLNETKMRPHERAMEMAGYAVLCQHDRIKEGGGIAVFAKNDMINRLSVVLVSQEFERCWFLVHTDDGPILFCCWYRPPGERMEGIRSFEKELRELRVQAVAVMIIGDLNVHQKQWLK